MRNTKTRRNEMTIANIQNIYLNGRKVTTFDIFEYEDNVRIYCGTDYIDGWYKRESTIERKYQGK